MLNIMNVSKVGFSKYSIFNEGSFCTVNINNVSKVYRCTSNFGLFYALIIILKIQFSVL